MANLLTRCNSDGIKLHQMSQIAIAMPPVTSLSTEDVNHEVSFKVINQDHFPLSMSIVGENILKPFGGESQKNKPNVIVRPTRRIAANLEESKPKHKSQGALNKCGKGLRKNVSKSQGNLNNSNSSLKFKLDELKNQIDAKFNKALDLKLKNLRKDDGQKSKLDTTQSRKPFITTVKKGQFLEPPPEIATLIGIKVEEPVDRIQHKHINKLYAFASQPRVLNRSSPKTVHYSRCEAGAKAAIRLGSVSDYQHDGKGDSMKLTDVPLPYANVMFEKRIFRGTNFAPPQTEQGDGESAAVRAAEARRRLLARKKAKSQQIRSSQLRLGSPPAVQGRKHERVQTETYLEEIFVNPPLTDMCTQTDLFLERPVSPFYVPAKTGADVETQIYPGDLFDFDMEVQPILEVLVGKTIEQALIEVLEEEELAALREQQRRFLEIRAAETAEALRLEEREKRLVKEKERRLAEYEEGLQSQKEMEERIAAAVLMQGYMANLLPSVLEGLESEGFLMDSIKKDLDDSFMPWLMKEVTNELQDMVSSRDILTDIVKEILENRAEIYQALNKETIEEEPEEEGPSIEDMVLRDHLKLQEEILKKESDIARDK